MTGRAAGIGPPPTGSPGQWPDTSAACAVTAWSVAASTICTVFVLPGAAGREPGTKPSGSDQ